MSTTTTERPSVLARPVTAWRLPGVHWHTSRDGQPGPGWCAWSTPHAVAGWLVRELDGMAGPVSVWAPERGQWVEIGEAYEVARLRMEFVLLAAAGESVVVRVDTGARRFSFHARFVTGVECDATAEFSVSLEAHCKGRDQR